MWCKGFRNVPSHSLLLPFFFNYLAEIFLALQNPPKIYDHGISTTEEQYLGVLVNTERQVRDA
jgi:hypothetical protein